MKTLKDVLRGIASGLIVFAIVKILPAVYETVKAHVEQAGWVLTADANLPLWTVLVLGFVSAFALGKLLLTLALHLLPKFVIVEGKYGIGDNYQDVTDRLKDYVVDNKLRIDVSNSYLGPDPAKTMKKVLIIRYRVWRIRRERKYIENDEVRLP